MAIQRNNLVAPFSVRDNLIHVDERNKPTGKLAVTHQKWFTQAEAAINDSAQLAVKVPANSASPGEPGQFTFDANWLYVCVGKNTWLRAALNPF